MRRDCPSFLLACLLATAPAAGAAAEPGARADLSLEQAVERVQQRFGARVVKAETLHEGGETVYRLRLLGADGRVSTVRVRAADGRVD